MVVMSAWMQRNLWPHREFAGQHEPTVFGSLRCCSRIGQIRCNENEECGEPGNLRSRKAVADKKSQPRGVDPKNSAWALLGRDRHGEAKRRPLKNMDARSCTLWHCLSADAHTFTKLNALVPAKPPKLGSKRSAKLLLDAHHLSCIKKESRRLKRTGAFSACPSPVSSQQATLNP